MKQIGILVADDEPIVRTFVRKLVQREQAPVTEVLEAANGMEALELAGERKPDLVFLDIRMPGLDGLEAIGGILQANPKAMIVMVTAHDDFEYARKAFRAGAADYLLKPLRASSMLECIERARRRKNEAGEGAVPPAPAAESAPERQWPAAVQAAAEYVRARLAERLTLADIASAAFVSPFHLSRMFARHTGRSLMEYVQEARLARAVEFLQATSLSMSEISERLGYSTPAYFSACFKKKYGLSPSAYRKKMGNI